jgi:RNA polymerase sigma factor (sigma-70 family)
VKPPTEEIFEAYKDRLFSIAFTVCRNREDAEDVLQDTLLRYDGAGKDFESEEHIKAWLIRVAINRAKDIRACFWRKNRVDWEEYMESLPFEEPADSRLFQAVMQLAEKYRIVIHMFYYEDYDIQEIAGILGCPGGTVKSRLSRARALLKQTLKEEWNDDGQTAV